jgi:hypothetical protein
MGAIYITSKSQAIKSGTYNLFICRRLEGVTEHLTAEELIFKETVKLKAIINILESKGILKAEDVEKEVDRMDKEFDEDVLRN